MKKLLIYGVLAFSFSATGQIAIENTEIINVLYRGYHNKFIIGKVEGGFDSLKVENGSISPSVFNGQTEYIIKPFGRQNKCYLYALKYNGGSVDTVDTKTFEVRNLPTPSLYWGKEVAGGIVQNAEKQLFVKYIPEVQLNAKFTVVNWEATINDRSYFDNGNELSEELLQEVRDMQKGETIAIMVKVRGGDGILRKLAGTWRR